MASGSSSGRPNNPGSRAGFDFASDDILCSYDDFDNRRESFNGSRSNPTSSSKDFHTTRVSRSSAFPTANVYAQPEDSLNQEVITTVEKTMKRHEDNLMRFLEGISSRLSQLELYCYNLDKSIGDMRSDLAHHNGEADTKLNSMDKHLQEVHRSVQLLKDKQELAETQTELAKLQLAQKDSSRSHEDDKSSTLSTQTKITENGPELHNQQLALALPPAPPSRTTENYLPASQFPNPAFQSQPPQSPYIPADSQYPAPQMALNPFPGLLNESPQVQQLPQYQQQWSPQTVPQAPPVQQTHIRAPPPQSTLYNPSYMQSQPPNPPLQEQVTSSMRMPYTMYDSEGPRSHQPPRTHFSQGGYSPAIHSNAPHHNPHPQQPPTSDGGMNRFPNPGPPQFVRNHQYSDLIEKVESMGYRGDHVVSVIQRLEKSGQPVDFNAVLDRLNGHSTGGSQRSW